MSLAALLGVASALLGFAFGAGAVLLAWRRIDRGAAPGRTVMARGR